MSTPERRPALDAAGAGAVTAPPGRLLARLTFTDRLVLSTGALMLLVVAIASTALDDTKSTPLALGLTLIALAVGIRWSEGQSPRRALLARLPGYLLWVWFFHAAAGVLIGGLGLPRYEAELNAIDLAVFGEPLTVLFQALHHPWLTEIAQVSYNLYYFIVLALPVTVALQGRRRAFFEIATVLLTIHVITVVGTLLLPAMWPTLLAGHPDLAGIVQYPFPLEGVRFTDALREATVTGTQHIYDTFPSGHTGMTVAAILLTARHLPRLLVFIVPFGLMIVFGTIYLRYHYGVDIFVGALNAVVVTLLVTRRFDRARDEVEVSAPSAA